MGIKGFLIEELVEIQIALTSHRNLLRGQFFPYIDVPKNKLTLTERTHAESLLVRLGTVGIALDCITEQIRRDTEAERNAEAGKDLITYAAMMKRMTEDSTKLETMEDAKAYIDKVSQRR